MAPPPGTPTAFERFRSRSLAQIPCTFTSGWEDVLMPYGMARAGRILGDAALLDWADAWARHHHDAGYRDEISGPIIPSRDAAPGFVIGDFCGNWAGPIVQAELQRTRPETWREQSIRTLCDGLLRRAIRFPDGAFAHGGWEEGRRTLWVDTMFYSSSVLAEAFAITGEDRYATEAVRQALRHADWLQDADSGLYFHDIDPATRQRSDVFWSRGNGWAILALADTLRRCSSDIAGREQLLAAFRRLSAGLLKHQEASGLWRILLGNTESHLETSGSTMILAGLACGWSEGWLDASAREPILRGWRELLTWIDPAGALQGAQRPAGPGGWETHKLSTLGECTYATGLLWRLAADLVNSTLVEPSDLVRRPA